MTSITETARALDEYMTFRARAEGVAHDLTVAFYEDALAQGCVEFFGVAIGRDGRLTRDRQNPDTFTRFLRGKAPLAAKPRKRTSA